MVIDCIEKNLSIMKPASERLQGWKGVLVPLFEWEEKSLREIKNLDLEEFIIKNPQVSDIPKLKSIEDKIKDLKKIAKEKENERKDMTRPIEDLKKKRLMIIEETYLSLSEQLQNSYISLKRIANEEETKAQRKQQFLSNFRNILQSEFNENVSIWNLFIQSKITELYEEALDIIEVCDLKNYLNDILWKHTERVFKPKITTQKPKEEEIELLKIYNEVWSKWDSKKFENEFSVLLMQTFSDFEIAKNQKEEAIKQRKAEQLIQVNEIKEEAKVEEAILKIEQKTEDYLPVFEKTKDLKKFWKINMDHTESNMILIHKAFYANRKSCLALYRGKDCWDISATVMANLLCLIKNQDPKFETENIVFIQDEKF